MCIRIAVASAALVACGASVLAPEDAAGLRDIAVLTGMGYAHQDAGTAGAALDRGAFCAANGILARQHLPTVDAGIQCQR